MNAPELLWKYADGECTPQEKAEIESRLATDPGLREELDMVLELHTALAGTEPEQPSMRFTQNLMEALPKIYAPAPAEPLVAPVWKKIFWAAVAVCFAGLLFWGKNFGSATPQPVPYVDEISRGLSTIFKAVPGEVMGYVVPLLLVTATLLLIDKVLVSKKLNPVEK